LRRVILADVVVDLKVVPLAVERRVDVAQVNRFIAHIAPQDVEVIAVVEGVGYENTSSYADVFDIIAKLMTYESV